MNMAKLQEAEAAFFLEYPGGFSDPYMLEIIKKHRVEKMNKLAQESFSRDRFAQPVQIVEAMSKIIGSSSLVSVFEKPKFRDAAKAMTNGEKELLAGGLESFLYGDQEAGFAAMTELLARYKIAKWPVLTVCPVYAKPYEEVLVKPSTAKAVIAYFELEGLHYRAAPTYEFYQGYRERIKELKQLADQSLQTDNTAFCGFLMMASGQAE